MNKETIEKAAKENASTHFGLINKEWWARKNGFEDGAVGVSTPCGTTLKPKRLYIMGI